MKRKDEILYNDPEYDIELWCKSQIFLGELYFSRGVKISDKTLESLNSIQEFLQYQIDRKRKFVKQHSNRFDSLFTEC